MLLNKFWFGKKKKMPLYVKIVIFILILVIYLHDFVDDNQFDKYVEIMRKDKVSILWASKENKIMLIPKNNKNTMILKRLNE
jgi:hypothetical protein